MTPDEVRNVVFRKPPIGQRGYREDDVDALLDLIEHALRRGDSAADIADIVRKAQFRTSALGRRGYDRDEVDDFLHLVQSTV